MIDLNLDTNTALLFSTEMNDFLGGFLRGGNVFDYRPSFSPV